LFKKLPSSFSAEFGSLKDCASTLSVAENGGILAIGLLALSEMLLVVLEAKRLAQDPTGAAGPGEGDTSTTGAGLLGSDSTCVFCGTGSGVGTGFTGSD